ncbi:hypothetical protein [Burkholderia anthina]|uniref:hypothetical protein n=1 Tax=Burkholderia anthina TaxID=179879 RepID=UPI001FC86C2A|nr:hypothetical protein [Burkholderia anthina]
MRPSTTSACWQAATCASARPRDSANGFTLPAYVLAGAFATMDCCEALAPACRVIFCVDDDTLVNLSPAGIALLDAAIDRAAGRRRSADGMRYAPAYTASAGPR